MVKYSKIGPPASLRPEGHLIDEFNLIWIDLSFEHLVNKKEIIAKSSYFEGEYIETTQLCYFSETI